MALNLQTNHSTRSTRRLSCGLCPRRQQARPWVSRVTPGDHVVDLALLQQELRSLESLWEILPDGLA